MITNIILSHRKLQVYQMALQGSVAVDRWVQPILDISEVYLIRQCLATSRAVCAHLAAAWGQQRHRAGFIGSLSTAQLEATEMQIWIEAAIGAGYLDPDPGQDLYDHYRNLYTALDQLMATSSTPLSPPKTSPENALPATA